MSLFAELDTQRARAEGLRKRLAWAYVAEAEQKLQTAEDEVAKCKAHLPRVENAISAAEEKLKEAQAEKSLKTKAMADYTAASAATVDKRKAAGAEVLRTRKAEEDARRQVSATQRERDDLQRKAARLTEARETARQTQQRETQAETSAADAVVARARAALEQARETFKRLQAEEAAAVQAAAEARQRCESLAASDEDLVREEREARDGLRRLQAAQSDGLAAFGDKMPALVRGAALAFARAWCQQVVDASSSAAINENARKFSAPPIGPLGAHLRLSDSRWGVVVEEAISNLLSTFLVANPADGRELQALAAKVGIPRQSVLAMNTLNLNRIYDMNPARLPDPSLTTLLRVLSSDRPPVLNALIDQAHIESVVLCDDLNEARRIAWRKNEAQSRNVTEVYTPDGVKLWLKGASEFTLSRQRNGSARISADISAQVQAAQKTLTELQARRASADAHRQEALAAQRRADEAVKTIKKRVQITHGAGKSAASELHDAEQAAQNLVSGADGGAAPDADAFDAELQEVAEEAAEVKKSLVAMEEELSAAAKAAAEAKEAADVVNRNAADVVEQSKQLAAEMNKAIEKVEDLRRNLEHCTGVRTELITKFTNMENDLVALRAHAASEATKAALAARCSREEAEATPLPKLKEGDTLTVARLTSLLSQVEARMAKEAARNKRPYEEVAGDLADASREVKRVKRALTHAMLPAKRMREGLTKRTVLLRRTARMLSHLCSNRFNTHMMQRGHAGRLVVNYQEGEMSLEVQLANTAPGNNGGSVTVTDTKQLSGGERSYTTLSFTLSLNESSDSPFCALDEWDVFMDAVARKVSLDKMMEYAEEHKEKQFILITPQDISAVKPNAYVTIQKLKPARQNS